MIRWSLPVPQIKLKVETYINPSESAEKIISSINNIINRCSIDLRHGGRVVGRSSESETLSTIYEQIRSRAAMGVLRKILLNNRNAHTTWFFLNKQAASAGVVVVIEDEQESPLGPIKVTINCEELDRFIDWLVPSE